MQICALKKVSTLAIAATAVLAGCSGGSGGGSSSAPSSSGGTVVMTTASAFTTPSGSGSITHSLSQSQSAANIDSQGVGYAMVAGLNTTTSELTALSGFVGDDLLTTATSSGQVTYDGQFEVMHVDRTSPTDTTASVDSTQGTMLMIVDFDTQQFAGESRALSGSNPVLSIEGSLTGQDMSGTASFVSGSDSHSATLDGVLDGAKAVGAFHGTTSSDAIAGGFLLLAQ